jgi:glycosyltransferase involved in cell wall biosynthesis
MPLVVAPEPGAQKWREPEQRNATRRKHRLPLRARLFCFAFDLNSSMHRKNPQACVEAFLRAFPRGALTRRQVGLVIKTHAPKGSHPAWDQLKALAAQDDRIHIIEGTLPRLELMALYAACDVFVSLHRAEGFGRGLAEALQLGLHLIATDYSGNTDFCHRPEFAGQISRVPFRLVKVRAGQYPYGNGQHWASPDVAAAAEAMRECLQAPLLAARVPRGGWPCFSAKVLGEVYAKRLRQVLRH